jgi:sugar/nucleoside kinase (ribokinase family)
MMNAKPILAVGSIALDEIKTSHGERDTILGGSATYFSIAASFFAPVRLVGIVGSDYPEEGWQLFSKYDVDVTDVQRIEGDTFRWGAQYSDDLSLRKTLYTHLGVFSDFKPTLSAPNRKTEIVYLANIQPSLQLDICREATGAKSIISDTMNLWITNDREGLEKVLKKAHIFMLNDEEAIQLTQEVNLEGAARWLLEAGPSAVVIKRGSRGALIATNHSQIQVPIYPHAQVVDPTGAGDSFAGGFIGHLASDANPDLVQAVIQGSATASYTVEGFGLDGLLQASRDGIDHRMKTIRNLMD